MTPNEKPSFLKRLWAALAGSTGQLMTPGSKGPPEGTPKGLVYLFSEPTPEEAELTRQILREQGFHIEYVPQMWTGVFGRPGSPDIYVRQDEVQEVLGFLKDLRFPQQHPEDGQRSEE